MKKRLIILLALMFMSVSLSGCQTTMEDDGLLGPAFVHSEYFQTKRAKFAIEVVEGQLESRYDLLLAVNPKLKRDLFLEVEFENPADRSRPIIIEKIVFPTDMNITLQSPIVNGRLPDQNYRVDVRIYTDKSKSDLIGLHRQFIRSYINDMTL